MKRLNKIFGTLIAFCSITVIVLLLNSNCRGNDVPPRDYAFEAYCDSIFYNNREYYEDVLVETDEYQEYLETHGQWWEDDCPAYLDMEAKYKDLEKANDFKRELLDAQENCIKEAELIMLRNGLYDEYYSRLKFKVDSLYSTQI